MEVKCDWGAVIRRYFQVDRAWMASVIREHFQVDEWVREGAGITHAKTNFTIVFPRKIFVLSSREQFLEETGEGGRQCFLLEHF